MSYYLFNLEKKVGKFLIIINDLLMILLVIVLAIMGTFFMPDIGTIVGIIIGAVIGGFWFVLSGIYHNSRRTMELMEIQVMNAESQREREETY